MNARSIKERSFASLSRIVSLCAAITCLGAVPYAEAQNWIQQRIDAASPGDTILVSTGTYAGNIAIHKRVTLIGSEGAIVRGDGTGSVVTITADSCVIAGFTIEHSGGMLMDEDAGILLRSSGNVIERNRLHDILFGIYLLRSHRNIIRDNSVTGKRELEVGERGSGIHIYDSHHNRFTGNVISFARDGFYIQNANHTWIEGNEVSNLRYGLHYMYADSNTFLRNRFFDNVAGAAIMYSRGIVMRRNSFIHNRGFASYGILFQDCHEMVADSNIVADNVVGMFFEASTNNYFRHNVIARNDVALNMFANSSMNTFTENNFIDNLSPLTIVGKGTGSLWSQNGRGNFWSSYDGYDLDHDGIGDVPMKIQNAFSYLEGQHPNLRLYLYSPASQALAAATNAFPILDINLEADPYPLTKPVDLRFLVLRKSSTPASVSMSGERKAGFIGITLIGTWVISTTFRKKRERRRS
jgi:nitrous oxidase accessory protein